MANSDCKKDGFVDDSVVDVCQIPLNSCSGNINYCELEYNKCVYSAGNTCTEVTNSCKPVSNFCNIPVQNECMPPLGDTCQVGLSAPGALKMCEKAQSLCNDDAGCPAGDVCGQPTSRTVIAKRTLAKIIGDNHQVLNLGLMTFRQSGYFPYFALTGTTPSTEKVYLSSTHLGNTCYDDNSGPKAMCMYNGLEHKLMPGANSQYQVKTKGTTTLHDVAWCGDTCSIEGVGTGTYQGSYYLVTSSTGVVTGSQTTFASYEGKTTESGGHIYQYYDARPDYYNGGPLAPINVADCSANMCSASCGARWDTGLSAFIKPTATEAESSAAAVKMIDWMDKASYGGLITFGGTPSGCTLNNENSKTANTSAYHYMDQLKGTDVLPCRDNFVLFLTDGEANGPGDVGCAEAACAAADPEKAGCECRAVLAAWRMRRDLGVYTFVVGFSADVAVGAARLVNDNIAKAGGTDQGNDNQAPYAFVATNETQLLSALQSAIYDAVSGSYATSPATASAGTQLSNGVQSGKYALDSRVDFPTWQGHLLAYNVTVSPPTLEWDAAEELSQTDWKTRRLYVGTPDGNIIKVKIDSAGNVVNRETFFALGLGATPEEAEDILQFSLNAPDSGNPAVLGAIINSTPIDVGQPGDSVLPGGHQFFVTNKNRPNLTYVGSSDGMLHAFFTENTKVAGATHAAGSEAFAFMPHSMFTAVTRIYAQRGQASDPRRHVFGLANSPKVKNLCVQNCSNAELAVWKTLLVMNEGYGGSGMFVLDITNPVNEIGFSEPPVMPMWHSHNPGLFAEYDKSVGQTISVPGFYFNKTDAMDDHRLVFASGYRVNAASSTQGKRILSAAARSGEILHVQTVSTANSCTQEFAMLADVATARNFEKSENGRLRAAYVGDTWGNLWRYDAAKVSKVAGLGCDHPIHFATTVVQLDRDDPSNNAGQAYLVQVTNSALDNETYALPPSKLVIMKEVTDDVGVAMTDATFGKDGQQTLTAGSADLCAVTSKGGGCTTLLPAHARPTSTPLAILKRDGSGFVLLSMWYAQDLAACSKGTTYLNVHEVVGDTVTQLQGLKVADEPVTSPVVAGGRILVVGSDGVLDLAGEIEASFSTGISSPTAGVGAGFYEDLAWTEVQ